MSSRRSWLVAALVSVLLVAATTRLLGGDEGATVVARFTSAAPLVEGNQVKVDGVVVGKVDSMRVEDNLAEVTMELDPEALPLHRDATFTIRPVSLLGERYVDLDRGDPKAPELDTDAVVPVAQTGTNVGLDELLNTVDRPTGDGLAALVATLGDGLQGNGKNADAVIRKLAPSLRDATRMTSVLKEHNALLDSLIRNVEPVASALAADDGKALDSVVASADRLLAAAARQQRSLDATLARLPQALSAARSTLGQLSGTAEQTTPTLEKLRPLTDDLPAIAEELESLSDALDPALASSQPVLNRAEDLLRAAAPVARDLRKGGPDLAKTVGAARPLVETLTRNRQNVFNFLRYWALTTNGHDGLSHYFRVNASVNPATLTGLLPTRSGPAGTGLPSAGQGPASKNKAGDALSGLLGPTGLLGGTLLAPPKDTTKSPTGLNQEQESSLLGFLFGGS